MHSSADLAGRNFYADRPNMLWVSDITHVRIRAGLLCLAVVPDAFSRLIAGWAMRNYLKTQLVLDTMNLAVGQSEPREMIPTSTRVRNTVRPPSGADARRQAAHGIDRSVVPAISS